MAEHSVIIVILRRPRRHDPNEKRSDPFWEFASFGCTGCHKTNLMNPARLHLLEGVRFAFAQGGDMGFALVHLTPPCQVIDHGEFGEVRWQPVKMPFRYQRAPLLINNEGDSDFPGLRRSVATAHRTTWVSKFASCFRSRREPLESRIAREIVSIFEQKSHRASPEHFARSYIDALPYEPNCIDHNREQTYRDLLSQRGRIL